MLPFTYTIEEDGIESVQEASLLSFLSIERMALEVQWLVPSDAPRVLPTGYFPVGEAGGFNLLLMETRADAGAVHLWPESDAPWGSAENAAVYEIAPSLSAFFGMLRLN